MAYHARTMQCKSLPEMDMEDEHKQATAEQLLSQNPGTETLSLPALGPSPYVVYQIPTVEHIIAVFGSAAALRDKRGAGIALLFMSSPSTVLFSCLPHVLYVSFLFFFVYFLPFLFSFFRARTWQKCLRRARSTWSRFALVVVAAAEVPSTP